MRVWWMMTQSKPIFNSVLLLTITMVIVKSLSAIYRVPYQNILGDEGLYAYQQVYPLVAIVSVVSLNALPSVMSSWMILVVTKYLSNHQYRGVNFCTYYK